MNAPYFIELLGRGGEVKSRQRVEQLPIRIGRAYDNDIILDDAHIAAHHAVIEQDATGNLTIRDLGSKNGMVHLGKRTLNAVLDDRAVTLGRSYVRVRSINFAVEPEILNTPQSRFEGWRAALIGISLIALSAFWGYWLQNKGEFSAVRYLHTALLALSGVLVWCGAWALVNRVVSSQARFSRHLLIVGCAFLLMDIANRLSSTIAYAFSLGFITQYASHILMVIGAVAVFFHLRTINDAHPKRLAGICLAFSLLGSGMILLSNYQRTGNVADELYMTTLAPPALRMTSDETVEAFINGAQALKKPLQNAREKPANEEAFDDYR